MHDIRVPRLAGVTSRSFLLVPNDEKPLFKPRNYRRIRSCRYITLFKPSMSLSRYKIYRLFLPKQRVMIEHVFHKHFVKIFTIIFPDSWNIFIKSIFGKLIISYQSSVAIYIDTSHLFCSAKQMVGFYMKRNTGLKWVNLAVTIQSSNSLERFWKI